MADYVLNMGGGGNSGNSNAVDVFYATETGVEQIIGHELTLSTARRNLAAASCGAYALAMGGNGISGITNAVDVFHVTENGVEHITDHGLTLSESRNALAAASCGQYILAMGGYHGTNYSNATDVFHITENGVEKVIDYGLMLSTPRNALAAAACGNYILAMGGYDGTDYLNTVDVFHVTENGVEAVTGHGLTLSAGRNALVAAACGQYILAMGGMAGSGRSNAVDVFKVTANGVEAVTDHDLTLSTARVDLTAASCGQYILAMGGYSNSGHVHTIDIFQIFN